MRTRLALCVALFAGGLAVAWAQQPPDRLKEATDAFTEGNYGHAIVLLREIVLDSGQTEGKAEAYYWLAMSYLALDNLQDGERSLEFYLSNYPKDSRFPDAFYEKGRLLFREQDYENAIQVLQAFLERYPDSLFVPNAYFWIGESLYSLGQLEDALLVFRKVVDSYPSSFKVEAARYRISLIEFKKRENELLKLLKWSHEESLRTIESFQRREMAYEQALAAYQRRIATYEQADYQKTIDALTVSLAGRQTEISELTANLAKAKAEIDRLESTQPSAAPAPQAAASPPSNLVALLEIKADALALKEALLDWMLARAGNR